MAVIGVGFRQAHPVRNGSNTASGIIGNDFRFCQRIQRPNQAVVLIIGILVGITLGIGNGGIVIVAVIAVAGRPSTRTGNGLDLSHQVVDRFRGLAFRVGEFRHPVH